MGPQHQKMQVKVGLRQKLGADLYMGEYGTNSNPTEQMFPE